MSRIGNKLITIPEKVEVLIKDMTISVKGPKGELATTIVDDRITFEINDGILTFSRTSEDKVVKSLHGLYRSLPLQEHPVRDGSHLSLAGSTSH